MVSRLKYGNTNTYFVRGINDEPINVDGATITKCSESRDFLQSIGVGGEIISTPSHSNDSISLVLDNGTCFVGELVWQQALLSDCAWMQGSTKCMRCRFIILLSFA